MPPRGTICCRSRGSFCRGEKVSRWSANPSLRGKNSLSSKSSLVAAYYSRRSQKKITPTPNKTAKEAGEILLPATSHRHTYRKKSKPLEKSTYEVSQKDRRVHSAPSGEDIDPVIPLSAGLARGEEDFHAAYKVSTVTSFKPEVRESPGFKWHQGAGRPCPVNC
ncbi:hypothetical protein Bbelb_131460 [Branchiostoma belcheri]|nr:hypothetical protein Bbelb_131460 [Branchiostoma belcheri]